MSAITVTPADLAPVDARLVPASRRQGMGIFLVLLAVIMFWAFGVNVDGHLHATFILTESPAVNVAPLTMDVRWVSITLAIVCAGLGVLLFTWRRSRGTYAIFTLGTILFLWSFLTWAARGATLNFVSVLAGTLIGATPLIYGSLSGIMCERSGVINIAIEGQFLAGAFLGAMIGSWTGRPVARGALRRRCRRDLWLAARLPRTALRRRPDHHRRGDRRLLRWVSPITSCTRCSRPTRAPSTPASPSRPGGIPLLSKIPIVGPVLFDQNFFVYLAGVLLVAVNVACSGPAGACGSARSASTRGRRRRSG